MYLHFFKIGRKIILFSWDSFNFERFFISINDFSCFHMSVWLVFQKSNPCFNRNLIFFHFDFCLYTSLWYIEAKVTCFLSLPCRLMHQARHKFLRKVDILHINGIRKEWSNLLIAKSGYAATFRVTRNVSRLCSFAKRMKSSTYGLMVSTPPWMVGIAYVWPCRPTPSPHTAPNRS